MSIKLLTWITTYFIILLCELGDKTQLAVLIFTSKNPRRRWTIFGASALALILCVVIEVTVGAALTRVVAPALINRFAGIIFLGLGLLSLYRCLGLPDDSCREEQENHVAQQSA